MGAHKKDRLVKFRIGEADYKMLLRLADDAGVTVSEYLRRLIIKSWQ